MHGMSVFGLFLREWISDKHEEEILFQMNEFNDVDMEEEHQAGGTVLNSQRSWKANNFLLYI